MQPSLFVMDAEDFMSGMQEQISQVNQINPEIPSDQSSKSILIENLQKTNDDMLKKMSLLVDLTKKVTHKMRG